MVGIEQDSDVLAVDLCGVIKCLLRGVDKAALKAADVIIAKINGSRETCRDTIDVALFEFNKQ